MSSIDNIQMSYSEINHSKKNKYGEEENKQKRKLRQLEKEYLRHNQEPSNRLGKNAKKLAARRASILMEDNIIEEPLKCKKAKKIAAWIEENQETEEITHTQVIGVKPVKNYGRIKRKPSHRGKQKRLEIFDYE
jgi:hypothetical protein